MDVRSGVVRIAVVVVAFPSVSETFILDHITGLVRRGHDVTIVADRPAEPVPLSAEWEEFALADRVAYRPSRSRSPAELATGLRTALGRIARSPSGARRIAQPSGRADRQRFDLVREVVVDAGLPDVDLFHCHYGPVGLRQVDALEVLALETPVVTTFHGFDITRHIDRYGTDCYERLWERGALFLPVSRLFRDRLIELGAPPDRTLVHHMGVDTSAYQPSLDAPNGDRPLRALTVGRLVEKKGVEWAIRAVALARDTGTDVTLTVIGDGPLKATLGGLAANLAAPVEFLGSTARSRVVELLAESDVLLAPSVTSEDGDMEGIPVALMEAMASGTPVISTNHSGIPELVIDGTSGLLAAERDVNRLAEHLSTLAGSPEERRRLGTGGREKVEAEFSTDTLDDQLVELYRDVITESGRRPLPS